MSASLKRSQSKIRAAYDYDEQAEIEDLTAQIVGQWINDN